MVLLSNLDIFLNAVLIYYCKNGDHLQECFAAFIWGEKNVQGGGGSAEIVKINLLRAWCAYIEGRISRKNAA